MDEQLLSPFKKNKTEQLVDRRLSGSSKIQRSVKAGSHQKKQKSNAHASERSPSPSSQMLGYSGNENVIKKITKKKRPMATLNKGGSSKVNLLKGFLTTTGGTSSESTIKQYRTIKKLENSVLK